MSDRERQDADDDHDVHDFVVAGDAPQPRQANALEQLLAQEGE